MIFMSFFLILAGLLMLFKTELLWKLTEKWTSSDATEPSDLYLWNTRFGGIACFSIGVVGIFVQFLL